MWKPAIPIYRATELPLLRAGRCLSCQVLNSAAYTTRLHSQPSSLRRYASKTEAKKVKANSNAVRPSSTQPEARRPPPGAIQFKQNPCPKQSAQPGDADFQPPTLDRAIGVPRPPREWENTGIDPRSIRQRRDDFVNYDRHVARRQELTRQVAKPYFREWSNLRHHQGKTFVSNLRLFKNDRALYFPNMYGVTLASPKVAQNTTTMLRGRISVVNLFSSVWAEGQVATFTGPKLNPGLVETLASGRDLVQRVDINLEENRMKAWLVKMFMWRMRGKLPKEQHSRYFLVQKGLTESLKEAIGMMNSKVGYVYLVDSECRIRWAGSGPAEAVELDALNAGVRKLIAERKSDLASADTSKASA